VRWRGHAPQAAGSRAPARRPRRARGRGFRRPASATRHRWRRRPAPARPEWRSMMAFAGGTIEAAAGETNRERDAFGRYNPPAEHEGGSMKVVIERDGQSREVSGWRKWAIVIAAIAALALMMSVAI